MARVCITVWLALMCTAVAASGGSSFTPETDQSKLPLLLKGCAAAASSITSGKGKITLHEKFYMPQGEVLEGRETKIDVAFCGSKLNLSKQIAPGKNDPRNNSKILPAPGMITTCRISCDGNRVIILDTSNKSATISTPNKGEGFGQIHNYRRDISIAETHGIWDVGNIDRYIMVPKDKPRADPKIVGRETLDGDECTVIELLLPSHGGSWYNSKWWFWVNPKKGFTIPRVQQWSGSVISKDNRLITQWDSELRQYAGGVWGPANTVVNDYRPGEDNGPMHKILRSVVTYDPGFQVNVPVSDADISISIPSGTNVHDEVLGADYVAP